VPKASFHLTRGEVRQLIIAARKHSRHGVRNALMILLGYRHGLRASELVDLRWSDIDLEAGTLLRRRRKVSRSGVHPLLKEELIKLRRFRARHARAADAYAFVSERGGRLGRTAFWLIVMQAGQRAGLPVPAFAHQLRHSTGYYLANRGCDLRLIQDYLGHSDIQSTVRYTLLASHRFRGLW
jgi:integrase